MNANRTCGVARWHPVRNAGRRLLTAMLLALPATAAASAGNLLTGNWADPLGTIPDAVAGSAVQPGDPSPLKCQEIPNSTTPVLLSLSLAVDLTLCNNSQIRSAWTEIKIQAAAAGVARSAYFPTISATASRLSTHTAYPELAAATNTTVGNAIYSSLNWRVFDFGTRDANRQAANTLLVAAMSNHSASIQKTLAAVVQAYFDAQSAKAEWEAKVEAQSIAQQTMESAERREKNGSAARSDTLQATTALARSSLETTRAFGNLRKTIASLVYTTGMSQDHQIDLPEENTSVEDDAVAELAAGRNIADLRALLRAAQQSHPAIQSARAKLSAAQAGMASTSAEGLPSIDFSINYDRNGYPGQAISSTRSHVLTAGIALNIPIFDGFSHTYKVRSAQATVEQKEIDLSEAEQSVLAEVVRVDADTLSSLQNLSASRLLVQAASESRATSWRKYQKGAADILEVLSTQTALAEARLEQIRCLSEWRSARLRLLASTGSLDMMSIRK